MNVEMVGYEEGMARRSVYGVVGDGHGHGHVNGGVAIPVIRLRACVAARCSGHRCPSHSTRPTGRRSEDRRWSSASTCLCFRRCMYVLGNEGSRPIDRAVCGVARLMFVGGWVYACMWMRVVWFGWGVVHVQSSPKHRCEYARTRLLRHREGIHDTSWSLCCPWSS